MADILCTGIWYFYFRKSRNQRIYLFSILKVKKFIIRILFFILGFTFLVHLLANLGQSLAPRTSLQFHEREKKIVEDLILKAEDISVLAVGNSHANSIAVEMIGSESYKVSRAGMDIFETQYFLESIIPMMPKLKTVLLVLSYGTFHWDNSMLKDRIIRRIQLYNLTPSYNFIYGDSSNYIIGKMHTAFPIMNIIRSDNWEKVLIQIIRHIGHIKGKNKKIKVDGGDNENKRHKNRYLVELSRQKVESIVTNVRTIKTNRPNITLDSFESLVSIIEFLRMRGIRLILFTPPYYEHYTKLYNEQAYYIIRDFRNNIQYLKSKYGIEYFDFSKEEKFISDVRVFHDSDHLNRYGSKLFTIEFLKLTKI